MTIPERLGAMTRVLIIAARFGRWRAAWIVAGTIATFLPIVVIGHAISA